MPITIPRQPDLVLVAWTRNPLVPGSKRTITDSRVSGSSRPCTCLLKPNLLLRPAANCLKLNDFRVISSDKTTAVSGLALLQR
ncbi:hypothetical protein ACFPPD_24985 [Cohnella suwonensis]|uniref:Uncharacterized protein n=1 Tax=Cohnella suwonensis TaxID=696072 RepID=A0ABW0M4S1_9BACL